MTEVKEELLESNQNEIDLRFDEREKKLHQVMERIHEIIQGSKCPFVVLKRSRLKIFFRKLFNFNVLNIKTNKLRFVFSIRSDNNNKKFGKIHGEINKTFSLKTEIPPGDYYFVENKFINRHFIILESDLVQIAKALVYLMNQQDDYLDEATEDLNKLIKRKNDGKVEK